MKLLASKLVPAAAQLISEGRLDPSTSFADMVLTPGAGSALDACVDIDLSMNIYSVVGFNKSTNQVAKDFILSYGFGNLNEGATNSLFKYTETIGQEWFYKVMIPLTTGVTSREVSK